jgi:hypothetical protein
MMNDGQTFDAVKRDSQVLVRHDTAVDLIAQGDSVDEAEKHGLPLVRLSNM